MSTLDLTIAFDKNQKNAQDLLAQIKEFCNSDASLDDVFENREFIGNY